MVVDFERRWTGTIDYPVQICRHPFQEPRQIYTPKYLQKCATQLASKKKPAPLVRAAALFELNFWSMFVLIFWVHIYLLFLFYVALLCGSWSTSKRKHFLMESLCCRKSISVNAGGSGGADYAPITSLDQSLLRTKIKGFGSIKFQFMDM